MNIFSGTISDIEVNKSLSLITVDVDSIVLKAIVVETPETAAYLKKGNMVDILFKETEVILAKESATSISIQNKIRGTVQKIERGMMLSKLVLNSAIGDIIAIVATEALDELTLVSDQEVIAMIKINEIMLSGR